MNAEPLAHVTGAVLAGGQSSRFGRDKALEPVRGKTLLEHALHALRDCGEQLIIGGDEERYGFTGVPVVPDRHPGRGPLGGLETALHAARLDRVALTACDMPDLTPAYWAWLATIDGEIVMPEGPDGRLEPLAAIYARSSIAVVRAELEAGRSKLAGAWLEGRVTRVAWEDVQDRFGQQTFRNVNWEDDLRATDAK